MALTAMIADDPAYWYCMAPVKISHDLLYSRVYHKLTDSCKFSAAPYGGPVAVAYPSDNNAWNVHTRMNSAKQLAVFKVYGIVGMEWTRCHRLIITQKNGRILVFTPMGIIQRTFHITSDVELVSSHVFHGHGNNAGLAVLTENNAFFILNSIMQMDTWRAAVDIPQKVNLPTAWTMLTSLGKVAVLSVYGDKFYLHEPGSSAHELSVTWKLINGTYLNVVASWDYSRLAFMHSTHIVQVVDSEFTFISAICFENGPIRYSRDTLHWCGNHVLALKRAGTCVQLASMSQDQESFAMKSTSYLDMELDGVKIYTESQVIFIQEVPEALQYVLGVASTEPGAILYEAYEKLSTGQNGGFEYLYTIKDTMATAVQQCLLAAPHLIEVKMQKSLLKAAALGKCLLEQHYDASQFVDTCRVIRVLNAIRNPQVGCVTSFAQSEEIRPEVLVDRLIDIEQWPLAIAVGCYVNVRQTDCVGRVLVHWAMRQIAKAERFTEMEKDATIRRKKIADLLISKLREYKEVSFADVARKAHESHLDDIAEKLLDHETNLGEQVEMYLLLNKLDKAMAKAAQSQQPELMHAVFVHLQRTQSKAQIDQLIAKLPQAQCLYQDYLREAPKHLLSLHRENDDFARQMLHLLSEINQEAANPFNDLSVEQYKSVSACAEASKASVTAELFNNSIDLINMSADFEGKSDFDTVCRTNLHYVYAWAAGHGQETFLDQLKKRFKISEKSCFVWKAEGYARFKMWGQFELLTKQKKIPASLMILVELCHAYGNNELGISLISKLTDAEDVANAYLLFGKPVDAAKYAISVKNYALFERIYSRYRTNEEYRREITTLMESLKK